MLCTQMQPCSSDMEPSYAIVGAASHSITLNASNIA